MAAGAVPHEDSTPEAQQPTPLVSETTRGGGAPNLALVIHFAFSPLNPQGFPQGSAQGFVRKFSGSAKTRYGMPGFCHTSVITSPTLFPTEDHMRVSPSKIKVFGDCANQYKYQYVLELPGQQYGALTVLGTVFHYAAEVYELYGHDIDLAVRTFRYYWDHSDELGQKIDWYPPRTSHESLKERGVEMLERYHDLTPWKGGQLVGTEIRFEVPLGNHILRGVVDKLFYRPEKKELQVIDFKTGAKVPKRLRYNLQFTCYLYATTRPEFWEQVPGWEHFWPQAMTLSRAGQWFHARDAKVFNVGYRDDADYRRLLLAVDQMEAAIAADIYPLTIEGEVCGWCPWLEDCGTEVESPNTDLREKVDA